MAFLKYCLALVLLLPLLPVSGQDIAWMSWEEAAAANAKKPRKLFVDVYTEWCGWCKRMDATTFQDTGVIRYINEHFYAIKLNAEQRETITWNGQEFTWHAGGRDGINKLAYDLLDGRLSYPTYVLMDGEYARILMSPGYMDAPTLMRELRFAAEDHYKNTSWEDFKAKS